MDPQGVWIEDCVLIGCLNAAIDMIASDFTNNEVHIRGNSLDAVHAWIALSGVGSPRVIDNTCVVGAGLPSVGISIGGTANYTAGSVRDNVIFGQGNTYAILVDFNWQPGANDGFLFVDGNQSQNCTGGYSIGGTAGKAGPNNY